LLLQKKKVVLHDMPLMMREMLREIVAEATGAEVVAEPVSPEDLFATVRAEKPDFVILSSRGPEPPEACRNAWRIHPAMRVLAISPGDGAGFLYELHPRRLTLGEVSPQVLIDVFDAASSGGDAYLVAG
jgi:DNA-binding NarL/FixJ family response regulator